MKTLADRLETLRIDLPSYRRDYLDDCISIARTKEFAAADPHTHRRVDTPAVAFNNVDRDSLRGATLSVLRVFEEWPHAMDDRELNMRYQEMLEHYEDTDNPLKFTQPGSSTVRSRRKDLCGMGMVVKHDDKGRSVTNRRAGRYILAPSTSPWRAAEPKRIT